MEIQDIIDDFQYRLREIGYETTSRNTIERETGEVVEITFRVVGRLD